MNITSSPGMYVVSFNMENPMRKDRYRPESKSYVNKNMIKVGKSSNLNRTMKNRYTKTFAYRESEPTRTIKYWQSLGYRDNNLKKCFGCNVKTPHHHVIFEYIKETSFLSEQDRKDIENRVKIEFSQSKIFGEYYKNDIKNDVIIFLDEIIASYQK
jgi:hypothetical protein